MEIKYNDKTIKYDEFIRPSEAKETPNVNIDDLGYNYYTLIMYDPDAVGGNHWHWVVSNIKNGKLDENTKKAILTYKGPSPPDEKIHHYIFELYGSQDNFKSSKSMDWIERQIPLNEGKEMLDLKERPIIQVLFRSRREKVNSTGGKKQEKQKTRKRKNKKSKTHKRRK